ncbi:MFS transporter [Trueperella pecoris]|uniref:MFS transporter n=1 Tax=Trueperella pecoris TaxID=2733571 RepID=UPI00186B9568|nr:glycoside-pentoside-hexuronide (GPH):cation symporter [Trueperella pecoris]QOQ38643.1 sugar (glycoside-pentoside-Hexuronide) transporter [Trueperella pecoris]
MTATAQGITPQIRAKRPFGLRDKLGYMFGDFGNDFTFILQAMFFTLFYTNVAGVKPAHVATLLLVARIFDGFTDVGMGIIVDRLPVKDGGDRFKRWIKFIAIPVAVASALMYLSFISSFHSYTLKVVWMCATYFLWGSVCYTAINIPYGSMASVMSTDADDRAQLSVYRSTGATLAQLVITSVLPLVVFTTNAAGISVLNGPRMTTAAIVCSVLAVVCYAICYKLCEERVFTESISHAGVGVGKMLKDVFSNRALGGLILAALLLLVSSLFLGGILGYLMLNWFGNGKLQSPASLAALIPAAVILIFLAPWLSKRFGKAEVGAFAMGVGGAVLLAAWLIKTENFWLWVTFYAVAMFAISTFNYLIWAFITDVIDYQEVKTGIRNDATVYSVYSWARKLGQAAAGGLTGYALAWVGFDSAAASQGLAQTDAVKSAIYDLSTLVPGVGCLLVGLALVFLYPLKKKVVDENVEILSARRAADIVN